GIASSTASGIRLSSGANVRKSVLTVGSATLAAVVVGGTVYVATGSTAEPLYDTTQPYRPQYACVDEDGSLAYYQTRGTGDPGWSDAAYFCWDGEGGLTRWAFPYETPTGACEDPSYYRPECGYVEETFVRQSKDWDPSYTVLSWKGNDPAARVVFEHNGVEYPAAREEGTDNVFSDKVQRSSWAGDQVVVWVDGERLICGIHASDKQWTDEVRTESTMEPEPTVEPTSDP